MPAMFTGFLPVERSGLRASAPPTPALSKRHGCQQYRNRNMGNSICCTYANQEILNQLSQGEREQQADNNYGDHNQNSLPANETEDFDLAGRLAPYVCRSHGCAG